MDRDLYSGSFVSKEELHLERQFWAQVDISEMVTPFVETTIPAEASESDEGWIESDESDPGFA